MLTNSFHQQPPPPPKEYSITRDPTRKGCPFHPGVVRDRKNLIAYEQEASNEIQILESVAISSESACLFVLIF